ncbi:uncharacterized protein EI97DRAFT_39803 [Westerdykella ornata]|uniref:Uncharacterized protein n=1 Tax=Westerdykella ornata TaxID=318751 RepID=A0A6A6JJ02_WESOR|nr:uncharacterized protein EI97DRAFT_39803 [Westerdykella ornata]KAF2276437.1 hypothetical protein EI97DRAFT_39803 [Westerdykella ornata]
MVDVAVSAQLEQWAFDNKSRAQHPDSSASSPQLCHAESETLRLHVDAPTVDDSTSPESKKALSVDLQDRYLSSEEDLSPMEMSDAEDEVASIHEAEQACCQARKMSVSRYERGKSCDMAVLVSYVSAGRPKVIDLAALASPVRDLPQRSASLAQLPMDSISKLKKMEQSSQLSSSAPSTISRPVSPASSRPASRRPSTTYVPSSNNSSSLRISASSSSFTDGSTRSNSPAVSEVVNPPASVSTHRPPALMQHRSSLYVPSSSSQTRPFPPLTPLSPETPSFLSSDPYESSTTSAASPIIKSSTHKRLRSISQRLALAKIAITPSTRKWDTRINGRPNPLPPTPATPYTPMTPQTAPIAASSSSFSPPKGLRRHSRLSRPTSVRDPSPEIPPVPQSARLPPTTTQRPSMQKLVPRGADEREPILELPPCPDEPEDAGRSGQGSAASVKSSRRIRKRKSLMDLL